MKTIKELRCGVPDGIQIVGSTIRYFSTLNIDFDVYLPTRQCNLQRGFVWTLEQKRELIWSIFYGRKVPPMSFINNHKDEWEVIDGKQRLSTYLDFYNNKFTVEIEGNEYLYKDLPTDYQMEIKTFYFNYYVLHEYKQGEYSDDFKVNWFRLINFAGTPQDAEHINMLTK